MQHEFPCPRTIPIIFLTVLLLAAVALSAVEQTSYARADEAGSSETETAVSSSDSDQVLAASGTNRFVVWVDDTPGNPDIFFRRSTDNGATWQTARNLSNNNGDSLDARIAVSGSSVYVVWFQANSADSAWDIFFRRSTDNGATWGDRINLSNSGTAQFADPRIAVSGANVYIVWHDNDLLFRRSTDNGATWKSIKNLSNGDGDPRLPEIAVSGSNVYLIWHELSTGIDDIQFRRSTDNGATWKAAIKLSGDAGFTDADSVIAVLGSNIYVVWVSGNTGDDDILFRRSTDNGATWKSIKNLSNDVRDSVRPYITTSGSNVHVVWEDVFFCAPVGDPCSEILYGHSSDSGATWHSVKNLSNDAVDSSFGMVAASGSNVYVVWLSDDFGDGEVVLRRSTDNGATWKSIRNLSSNDRDGGLNHIAVSGSNVYVVWPELLGSFGQVDIQFKRSTDNGATWKSTRNLSDNPGGSEDAQIAV